MSKANFPFEPLVRVGLLENSPFGLHPHGKYQINASDDSVSYYPLDKDAFMEIRGMKIGIGFHWEQKRTMRFPSVIVLKKDEDSGNTILLNILKVEEYLKSVVGSEMSPESLPEYIKAHAIISRTWLLRILSAGKKKTGHPSLISSGNRIITFTQHDSHQEFDVCADDHCQRYQGLDNITANATAAVEATRGVVLTDAIGELADARFSKCCGGCTEQFHAAWDEIDFPYLPAKADPFCNPDNLDHMQRQKLGSFLKNFDAETPYFRWKQFVPSKLIEANLQQQYSTDLGSIISLSPEKRGESGRIYELKIIGSSGSLTIGKELAIRRLLSESHLYSSAFDIENAEGGFMLYGKGWGHGVGLCQTGAAGMALKGYTCRQILDFYFPGTELTRLYD